MNKTIIIAALVAFALVGSVAFADNIPATFAISGRLTDSSGNVLNGNYNMSFQLYNQSGTAGRPLWTEYHDGPNVTVTKGVFSVLLGNNSSYLFPQDIFHQQLWLQMIISGENITPRQPLTGVPYAFRSNNTDWLGNNTAASYPRLSLPNNFTGINTFSTRANFQDGINVTAQSNFTGAINATAGLVAGGAINATAGLVGGISGGVRIFDTQGQINATSLTGLCTIGSGGCNLGLSGLSATNVTTGTLPEPRIPLLLTQAYTFQGLTGFNVTNGGVATFLGPVNASTANFTGQVNASGGIVAWPGSSMTIVDSQGRINGTSLVGLCNLGTGCGFGLTGISATNVTAGELPEARMPLLLVRGYDFQGISALNVTGQANFMKGLNATAVPSNFSSFNVTNLATFLSGVNVTGASTFVTQVNMSGGLIAGPSGEVRIYDEQGRINATSLVGLCNIGSGCGWGLTGISAANVTAGTLPEARLPTTLTQAYRFQGIASFNVTNGGEATFLGPINASTANFTGQVNASGGIVAWPGSSVTVINSVGQINATNLIGICTLGSGGCNLGLTGISATNVTTGTLPEARIPLYLTQAYRFEAVSSLNVTGQATFLGGINATAANITGLLNVTGNANFTGLANFSSGINITGGILNVSSNITLKDGNYLTANGTIGYFNSSSVAESGSNLPIHSMIIQGGNINPTFVAGDGRADATVIMGKLFRNGGSYAVTVNRIYNFTEVPSVLPTQSFTIFPINASAFNITYNVTHSAKLAFSWIAIGY